MDATASTVSLVIQILTLAVVVTGGIFAAIKNCRESDCHASGCCDVHYTNPENTEPSIALPTGISGK
jgi:hypothetical protein